MKPDLLIAIQTLLKGGATQREIERFTGVARPSAQGHAMIRTEMATTNALASAGGGPTVAQTENAAAAPRRPPKLPRLWPSEIPPH